MAFKLVSDRLWKEIHPLLPPETPKPKGGRPRLPDWNRVCPSNRHALASCANGTGMRVRRDLLASAAGVDAGRSLATHPREAVGIVGPPWSNRRLAGGDGQCRRPRGFGGAHTGPNPTDRAKKGCKRHILTDARGVPRVVLTTPANVHDSQPAIALLDKMPRIPGRRGRPREKPDVVLGDRAYGTPKNIAACRARGILPLPARIGTEHESGLGSLRWVVESCLAWFGHNRRIKLCYERTGEHFQAFHDLAATLICARKLKWL